MVDIPFEVGMSRSWTKTIGESDVYLFGGVTGDLSRNHVNEEYMKSTPYGGRIAHGLLSLCLSGVCSTAFGEMSASSCVSYGYDRVRFIKPVVIGDTLTVTYTFEAVDRENAKTFSKIEVRNQRGDLCTVATHIMKLLE